MFFLLIISHYCVYHLINCFHIWLFFHYFHSCFLFIYSVHFSVFFRFADSCLHFQPLFIFTSSIFSYFLFCYLFSDPYIFLSDFDFFFVYVFPSLLDCIHYYHGMSITCLTIFIFVFISIFIFTFFA